jgi:hypothetical protein
MLFYHYEYFIEMDWVFATVICVLSCSTKIKHFCYNFLLSSDFMIKEVISYTHFTSSHRSLYILFVISFFEKHKFDG